MKSNIWTSVYDKTKISIPVENAGITIYNVLCSDMTYSQESTELMTKTFGKYTGTFRGEFLHKIWALQYKKETYHVLSSKRGTSFEIVDVDYSEVKSKKEDISEFLKAWLEEVKENQNG